MTPLRASAGAVAGVALLFLAACEGTEGTLVVRGGELSRDGAGGAGSGGAASAGSGGSGTLGRSPAPGVTWQAQLSGSVDSTLDVELFYLDADFASPSMLSTLRASGRIVLCYVSAGTFEPWREDANAFPESALGEPLLDYPREQWIDFRDSRVKDILRARLDGMSRAGCDGVYPSTLEAHREASGFDLGRSDVVAYARWLAGEIHARGMSAGLSVSAELVPDVENAYDWALAIDCLAGSGCAPWVPVRQSGRAVLLVEFGGEGDAPRICTAAKSLGFDAIVKRPAFDAFRVGCEGTAP